MPLPLIIICLVLLAAALLILLVLSLKGTLTIEYKDELSLYFSFGPIKIKIFPFKEKKKKHLFHSMSAWRAKRIRNAARRKEERRLKRKAKRKKPLSTGKKPAEKKKSGIKLGREEIGDIIGILQLATELAAIIVKRFAKRLHVKVARLRVKVASPDAATTALAYGAVTQTVNILLPILSETKHFDIPKKKDFDISCDFLSDTPEFDLKIAFSLRVWHLFDIPFAALKRLIPEVPKYIEKAEHYKKKYSKPKTEEKS